MLVMAERKWLTAKQVARRLDVSPETVKRWLRSKKLAGYQFTGGTWRIYEDDFERFLASRRNIPEDTDKK